MSLGPIDLILITFPKNRFRGEILAELKDLTSKGIIKIIDIMLVKKGEDGTVTVTEIADLEEDDYQFFDPFIGEITGLLNEKDAYELAKKLSNDSSAGIMLFENTWARDLADAIARAGGEVKLSERIPRAVVEELVAAAKKQQSAANN